MRDNRGIDRDIASIARQFQDLRDAIESVRNERRSAATTITEGDLTVAGGGSIRVLDGGDIALDDDGVLNIFGGKAVVWGDSTYAQMLDGQISVGTIDPGGALIRPAMTLQPDGFLAAYADDKYAVFRCDAVTGAAVVTSSVNRVLLPYTTTSDAANTRILLDGTIQQVVSSRRYKQNEAAAVIDPEAVLALVGKTWRDRADVEDDPQTTRRYVGFIAEDLHDQGLSDFVDYDDQGRPDAIQYDRLSVALLAVLKDQSARLTALEQVVATLTQEP